MSNNKEEESRREKYSKEILYSILLDIWENWLIRDSLFLLLR